MGIITCISFEYPALFIAEPSSAAQGPEEPRPEIFPALAAQGRKPDEFSGGHPQGGQVFGQMLQLPAALPLLQLVRLGEHWNHQPFPVPQILPEKQLFRAQTAAAVLEEDHRGQNLAAAQIFQHQLPPPGLEFFGNRGIAEPRQIYEVPAVVHQKEVEGPGAARLGAGAHQFFAPQQDVDQGGFPHVGAAQEGHFGQLPDGQLLHPVDAEQVVGGDNLGDGHGLKKFSVFGFRF
jgi:hypothetical protein